VFGPPTVAGRGGVGAEHVRGCRRVITVKLEPICRGKEGRGWAILHRCPTARHCVCYLIYAAGKYISRAHGISSQAAEYALCCGISTFPQNLRNDW